MSVAAPREVQQVHGILPDCYFTFLEVLVLLFLAGGIGVAFYWARLRCWRNRLVDLQQRHADDLAKHDSEYVQELHNHLQSAVAHEFIRGLDYISKKSAETLERLGDDQEALRQRQKGIVAQAYELDRHAENILALFASEGKTQQKEFLNLRGLVESASIELVPYAESRGVTLMATLDDVEPTPLNRELTLLPIKNVIHNAVKYSFPGGVVQIALSLESAEEGAGKSIWVEVKDTGKGILQENQDTIFELRKRGDGLIEPGSGLGLFLAREAARRQGGDLILVHSSLNQGSVFRLILPYTGVLS
jgi:signal transduction histidine kinase